MTSIIAQDSLNKLFLQEKRTKISCHVGWNQTEIRDSNYSLSIELGSCVAVVLCAKDKAGQVYLGANHLFKSRDKDQDMALTHVASLYNELEEKPATDIRCLGVFGAGYNQNSLAKDIAMNNIQLILESLSIFNLSVELFQTGFRQGITILTSHNHNSILLRHYNIIEKKSKIIKLELDDIFS